MFILEKKLPLFFCSLNHNNRPPSHMLRINRSFYYCQNSFDKCTGMLSSIISDVAYNLVSRNAMPIAVVTPHGMVMPKLEGSCRRSRGYSHPDSPSRRHINQTTHCTCLLQLLPHIGEMHISRRVFHFSCMQLLSPANCILLNFTDFF